MKDYRILEEKFPNHSLWYPQYKDSKKGDKWLFFSNTGMPYDRKYFLQKEHASWFIDRDKMIDEFEQVTPEVVIHEVK
ncbi:MAG: hypothetical protein EBY07_06055 [Actinobacteria bacterium]|nr:hypothetical protein [Actinomycetota bacterium]